MRFKIRGIGWVTTWNETDLKKYCDGLFPEIFSLKVNESLMIGNSKVIRTK